MRSYKCRKRPRIIGIYKITNKLNGKCYIGQSVDILLRWQEHNHKQGKRTSIIKQALHKYGIDNFTFEVLEECSKEELNAKEIQYIFKLKPQYNIRGGGGSIYVMPEETKRKISIAKTKYKKPVKNLKTGIIYESLIDAERKARISRSSIKKQIERQGNWAYVI